MTTIADTNPFVQINVKNSKGEVLFYSSDPLEIGKHNFKGLKLGCYISINKQNYIIKELDVIGLGSSPMDYKYGTDSDINFYVGRKIPFLCNIKIIVTE